MMFVHRCKRARGRDLVRMNRSQVGIPFLGTRIPTAIHEILVRIPSSGNSGYPVHTKFIPFYEILSFMPIWNLKSRKINILQSFRRYKLNSIASIIFNDKMAIAFFLVFRLLLIFQLEDRVPCINFEKNLGAATPCPFIPKLLVK